MGYYINRALKSLDLGLKLLSRGWDYEFHPTIVGECGISRHFIKVGKLMKTESNRLLDQYQSEAANA